MFVPHADSFLIHRHARDGQRHDFFDRKRCRALQEERFTAADDASLLVRMVGAFGFLQDAVGMIRSGGSFGRFSELFGGAARYLARIDLSWRGNCVRRKARKQDTKKNAGTD